MSNIWNLYSASTLNNLLQNITYKSIYIFIVYWSGDREKLIKLLVKVINDEKCIEIFRPSEFFIPVGNFSNTEFLNRARIFVSPYVKLLHEGAAVISKMKLCQLFQKLNTTPIFCKMKIIEETNSMNVMNELPGISIKGFVVQITLRISRSALCRRMIRKISVSHIVHIRTLHRYSGV